MTRPHASERAGSQSPSGHPPRGLLLVLSGPSGVGKDAMLQRVLPRMSRLRRSISVTTRPARPGEQEGSEYFFRSDQEFDRMLAAGELLESAQYLDYRYGTPRAWVEEQLRGGADVVLEIDVQGALQVRRLHADAVLVFAVPPNWEALAERLARRQTETAADLEKRLQAARRELKMLDRYDYVIVNDDLERAARQLECVIEAERCRPRRADLSALRPGGSDAA